MIGTHRLTHLAAAVGPQRDLRREQFHQFVDVAADRRGEEPLGGFALLGAVGLEPRSPGAHVLTRAVSRLAHR